MKVRTPKLIKKPANAQTLVILLPPQEGVYSEAHLGGQNLRTLQDAFNTDSYQLGQWFKSKSLRVLKAVSEEIEATRLANLLNAMGLRSVAISNQALSELGYSFRARKANLQTLEFESAERTHLKINPQASFILVQGRIKVSKNPLSSERKKDRESTDLDRAAIDTSDYLVFDLFSREAGVPALRVKSSAFDFTCLGKQTGPSSALNFASLLKLLKERCPNLKFDESFNAVSPVFTDEKTAGLFDPTVEMSGEHSDYQNNERQFEQYARIVCYLAKKDVHV